MLRPFVRRAGAGSSGHLRRLLRLLTVLAVLVPLFGVTTASPAAALNAPISGIASTPTRGGYWLVARDGGVFSFGDAPFFGSMASYQLPAPVVGMAANPVGLGYWLVGSDGAVYAFGDTVNHGSMAGQPLSKPVVGIAATPTGRGYWLASADGGVFAFGDAPFHGNMVGQPLAQPVSGIAAHPTSGGYWLTAGDGGVFAFGAPFQGSMAGHPLNKPVVGIATSRTGNGYWLVGGDGGVYGFGDAPFRGSAGGSGVSGVVGIAQGPAGDGYWLTASDGGVFAYGSAPYHGNMVSSAPPPSGNQRPSNDKLRSDIVAMAQRHIGYDTPSENRHNFTHREQWVTRAWCADFISDVWVESGVQGWQRTPRVDKVREYAEKRGMFRDRNHVPAPGDVAIYKGNGVSHVNIVIDVDANGRVRTVGGNEGPDTVVRRGFHNPKTVYEGALVGYALPNDPAQPYHQEDTSGQQPEEDQPENVLPNATVSDATVTEGGVATFTVTLDYSVSYPITLTYSTVDGTAVSVADLDYRAARSVNVQLAAGQASVVIEVPTTEDTLPELAESFSLEVASTDAVALVDGVAAGTIVDNDTL